MSPFQGLQRRKFSNFYNRTSPSSRKWRVFSFDKVSYANFFCNAKNAKCSQRDVLTLRHFAVLGALCVTAF